MTIVDKSQQILVLKKAVFPVMLKYTADDDSTELPEQNAGHSSQLSTLLVLVCL